MNPGTTNLKKRETWPMSHWPAETILQFGTGKFLRGFADLFVHELRETGTDIGRVVVVQSTGRNRAEALSRQGGSYHVAIRGIQEGARVDRTVRVRSISRALCSAEAWDEVLRLARSQSLEAIISNTTEAGYALPATADRGDGPPQAFPAKLLHVLRVRFETGLPGITILPCELVEENGSQLLELVLRQAQRWGLPSPLRTWLKTECRWPSTLVDRIVASPRPDDPLAEQDPLMAVAEPFALWLIERPPSNLPILAHPAVEAVDDLGPYHLRKVRILNGAHSALVAKALPMGVGTVRQAVEDERIRPWLQRLLFEEIVPTIEDRTDRAGDFAHQTLERFANPFLEHRLADIALHHETKILTRLVPTRDEFRRRFGRTPALLDEILSAH